MTFTEELGKFLKSVRKARGYTQEKLAAKIGVGQNTISQYESGIRSIDMETLSLIMNELGGVINVSDRFEGLYKKDFAKIIYEQEGKDVKVFAYSPHNPTEIMTQILEFDTAEQAYSYCVIVNSVEVELSKEFGIEFAIIYEPYTRELSIVGNSADKELEQKVYDRTKELRDMGLKVEVFIRI